MEAIPQHGGPHMRFPSSSGCIASVTVSVPSLDDTMPFWRGVLHPLGYGRISEWPGYVLWARDGSQLLLEQSDEAGRVLIMLRAASREQVDAIHACACAERWPVRQAPSAQFIAPGYYGCILAVPGAESIRIAIAHAWEDLPERPDATRVRIAGADPDVLLGGYLFKPAAETNGAVIVIHGYGGDANGTASTGRDLAAQGWTALCVSQRGWLGSTGREDQGLRQPDDVICAAEWLTRETGADRIGLLGFSQGGQVALLAAARGQSFACVVAYFPCTDLATWLEQTDDRGIRHYIEDFVAPDDIARCSPLDAAGRIAAPTLLIHGEQDATVPIAQSEAMVAANPAIRLRRVPGGTHGLWEESGELWPEALEFFNRHLSAR
jgi:pimeloyl-ACP methyl ester carboxylesterase